MKIATAATLVWIFIAFPVTAATMDCETLKSQIAPQMNASHAAALAVVRKEEVGDAKILGHCAGGTMRVVLPRARTTAGSVAMASNDPRAPGTHQSVGPPTCVSQAKNSVTEGKPPCEGSVTPDAMLDAFKVAAPVLPGLGPLLDYMQKTGWGNARHQNFANCRLACAVIPTGIPFTDDNLTVRWNPHGPTINGTIAKKLEGRWDAGDTAYWRVDPGFFATTQGDKQIVCKQVRNWATAYSRLFQLVIDYKVGTSSTAHPPVVDPTIKGCAQ